MMNKSPLFARLVTSFGLLLAISAASPDCWAFVTFVGDCHDPGCIPPNNPSTDFNLASNWDPATVPPFPNATEAYLIQDNRTAIFSGGSTSLGGLTVANDSFGRLRMTGGSLTLVNRIEPLEVGRERFPKPKQGDYNNNGIVDTPDYNVWRDTLGQEVLNAGDGADGDQSGTIDEGDYLFWKARFGLVTKGGEVILTGSSTVTTNGAVIGRRSKGFLSVGPTVLVDVKGPNFAGSITVLSRDLEVGAYGRAFINNPTTEPGMEADGLAIVEGTVNANALILNTFGAKGELRVLPGAKVNLNGALVMSHCDTQFFMGTCGLIPNPEPLMSSKLSIIGSGGTFNVGKFDAALSPPANTVFDPDHRRDIRSKFPSTATISFTADAGGVTPIVLVDNSAVIPAELTGTAYLQGTVGNVVGTLAKINLELNLDAYASLPSPLPLTLINAPHESTTMGVTTQHLVGMFAEPTYLGIWRATVNYDYVNGDVFLNNFHIGAGAGTGSPAGAAVPEPSGLALMTLALGLLLCSHSVRERNGGWPSWHGSRTA